MHTPAAYSLVNLIDTEPYMTMYWQHPGLQAPNIPFRPHVRTNRQVLQPPLWPASLVPAPLPPHKCCFSLMFGKVCFLSAYYNLLMLSCSSCCCTAWPVMLTGCICNVTTRANTTVCFTDSCCRSVLVNGILYHNLSSIPNLFCIQPCMRLRWPPLAHNIACNQSP